MLQFLDTGSAKGTARVSIDMPRGRFAGLLCTLAGTTDTGKTLALEDIGRIRIQRGGRQIQGEDWEFYGELSNLKSGYANLTVPQAAATRVAIFVPFSAPGLQNSIDIRSKEEVDLFFDFDVQLDTEFGANAATYTIFGVPSPAVPETYELHVEEQDMVASAAGRLTDVLTGRNIAAVFMKDVAPAVSDVTLRVDGVTVVNAIDDAALLDLTNMRNRVEATGQTLIELNLAPARRIQETRNDHVDLDATFSGAGTLEVTKFRIEPSGRAEQSIKDVQTYLASRAGTLAGRLPSRPAGAIS